MQGQCKPSAIELARIAEAQPVLAALCKNDAKVQRGETQKPLYRGYNRGYNRGNDY